MEKKPRKSPARKDKEANAPARFRLSPTSGSIIPLQTIKQRLLGLWQSLTWPVFVKVIKANIAVTIALGLLLVNPVGHKSGISGILASVAVEFVHPTKSYGLLAEDVLFGSVMCVVSAAWSILAIYLASLVRNPLDATMAQPAVCAILACFLIVGCFFLNLFRVKVEQANVGAMLAGTIMAIGITSAVQEREFTAVPVLQELVSILVGFALILAMFLIVFPENSTTVYVLNLIKLCETFDGFAQQQVSAFLRDNSRKLSVPYDSIESVAKINQAVDTYITTLVQKKRMVRRELSFNLLAPTDISEMTALIKKLRVPLQGLALSRAMEENMRKAEEVVLQDSHDHHVEAVRTQSSDPIDNLFYEAAEKNGFSSSALADRPRSYYGGTDDEDVDEAFTTDDEPISPFSSRSPSATSTATSSSYFTDGMHSSAENLSGKQSRRHKVRWEDNMKVMTYWRKDYDEILSIVKPTYFDLSEACTIAIREAIKRLRKLQSLDPRYENKPFFYKYYYRWKVGTDREKEEARAYEYDPNHDPSVPLFKAIQKFQEHRLIGLDRLFTKSGVPRRILFLLLTFQLNLHTYAEQVYTFASHVYELEKTRTKYKLRWPHISLRKYLFQSYGDPSDEVGPENSAAIANANASVSLQRSLSRRATIISSILSPRPADDLEAQNSRILYRLNTPERGRARTASQHYDYIHKKDNLREHISSWRQNELDPLDYHDPDVAYPTTPTQRFFYSLYRFLHNHLYTTDVAFAFRAATIVALLSLPGFLEDSVQWYNTVRGQWAVVVALIWMGPLVGSNFFGTMTRTVGTIIGAIQAIIIWEAGRGTVQGLIILSFVFNLPWWLVYIHGKFWKATGMFALVTVSIIIGYAYGYKPNGQHVSVYIVTLERMLAVLTGVAATLIISIFPFPRTGRVILRRRISQTLGEIGALYSSFLSLLLKNTPETEQLVEDNHKLFDSVAKVIRSQIQGERVLLEQSRFEPALRGVFPEDKYLHILQILENILSLIVEMEFAMGKIPYDWRMAVVKDTWRERKEMISSYLIALHLGSFALINKSPIPPYVIRPTKARRILTNKARKLPIFQSQNIGEREYTYYSSYLMSSEQLAVEIELLVATIRDLVGPDSVSIWLKYKH
ncbi:Uncharacterized protein C57A7.05 [Choanephora cucurbitarum]|uniref:Uncharacterized protein C57A7.05 n=1 Tax=Choanephora cucurbitarum TaxID=101091 RepID=A0A1C7N272_9FUNG|nr:Uncharacterized protein C57A7.05 [Choanephora cucurbitarum]